MNPWHNLLEIPLSTRITSSHSSNQVCMVLSRNSRLSWVQVIWMPWYCPAGSGCVLWGTGSRSDWNEYPNGTICMLRRLSSRLVGNAMAKTHYAHRSDTDRCYETRELRHSHSHGR